MSTDLWHFICEDNDDSWTWRRVSSTGDLVSESDFSFKSFNVCCADAERAGYQSRVTPFRRLRASELVAESLTRARRSMQRGCFQPGGTQDEAPARASAYDFADPLLASQWSDAE